jgi:hypothetical protein
MRVFQEAGAVASSTNSPPRLNFGEGRHPSTQNHAKSLADDPEVKSSGPARQIEPVDSELPGENVFLIKALRISSIQVPSLVFEQQLGQSSHTRHGVEDLAVIRVCEIDKLGILGAGPNEAHVASNDIP